MTTAQKSPVAKMRTTHAAPMVRMASGQRVVSYSLADPEVADRVNALHEQLAVSKDASIKFLKKIGILNRSGKLSKNFGG